MMRAESIIGLTPKQAMNKFSVPLDKGVYSQVSIFEIPSGTEIIRGWIQKHEKFGGVSDHAVQYYVDSPIIPESWIRSTKSIGETISKRLLEGL